jgi:hypothetical protein
MWYRVVWKKFTYMSQQRAAHTFKVDHVDASNYNE